ncbi:hypothetical protein SH139x_002401 [Planctomycetaceae bacterium SH139]
MQTNSKILSDLEEPDANRREPDALGDRLDSAIGETSSGMGAMLSELIRRSLKSGVSDIGKSLGLFAEEQVEQAVARQMPAIAEAADEVAESTAKRIINSVAKDWSEKSEKQREEIVARIQTVESSAIDRSRMHVDQIISQVRKTISETQAMASQHQESSEQKLEEIQQKGRRTWSKIKEELEGLNNSQRNLQVENAALQAELANVRQQAQTQLEENLQLKSRQAIIEERLAKLEAPKGLRGLLAKMGGGSKKKPNNAPSAQENTSTEASH